MGREKYVALSGAIEAMAEVELLLEGLAVSLDMMWERLQNERELDRVELAAFIWSARAQAKAGAQRLSETSGGCENAQGRPALGR